MIPLRGAALAAGLLAAAPGPATAGGDLSSAEREETFRQSMEQIAAGRLDEAVRELRRLLALDPRLARVRLELARALFLSGAFEEAREQFLIALSGSPPLPPEVRDNVLEFVRRIDARSGVEWTMDVAVGLHPEAGRRYDSDDIEIDVLGQPLTFRLEREEPPLVALSGRGGATVRTGSGVTMFGGRATGFARARGGALETEGSAFDERTIEGSAGGRWTGVAVTMEVAPFLRLEIEGDRSRELTAGARLSGEARTGAGLSVFGTVEAGAARDDRRDGADGFSGRLRAGVVRSFRGRGDAGVAVFASAREAEADWIAATEAGAELFGRIEAPGGWTLRPRVHVLRHQEEGASPGLTTTRDESEAGGVLRATRNDIFLAGRFSPYVEVAIRRRDSSIDALSFTELGLKIGVERSF